MNELKTGYRAVFCSGENKLKGSIRETYEEAQKEIEVANETYSVFKYKPWSHANVEEVKF